jgi:penicillin amidase
LSADDRSAQFAIKAAKARAVAQLLAAAADVRSPQQNLIYADDAGAVGLHAIGRLPLRAAGNTVLGRLPVPGWDALYDWQGEVPFEALPAHAADEHGRVQNANDKITTPDYPHWVTSEWELPYRADRIAELLDQKPKHSLEDFARMQLDVHNPLPAQFLPVLLAQLGAVADEYAPLIERLRVWDGTMSRERPEALVFEAWLDQLAERLYPQAYLAIRPAPDPRVLYAMLQGEESVAQFCGPQLQRDCARLARESFIETIATLRARFGTDIATWNWGAHNVAWFNHALFSELPGLGPWLDTKLARAGSAQTINLSVTSYDAVSGAYVTGIGPSLRAVYDLAQPEHSLFVVTPGQSGNPLSPRYRDLATRWENGEYVPMITDREHLQRESHETLILSH